MDQTPQKAHQKYINWVDEFDFAPKQDDAYYPWKAVTLFFFVAPTSLPVLGLFLLFFAILLLRSLGML